MAPQSFKGHRSILSQDGATCVLEDYVKKVFNLNHYIKTNGASCLKYILFFVTKLEFVIILTYLSFLRKILKSDPRLCKL